MDLLTKLQVRADQSVHLVGAPTGTAALFDPSRRASARSTDAGLVVFVRDRAALATALPRVVRAAARDRLTWVAYPKSGQLSTDLNRDSLAAALQAHGVRPVRQIAVDDVWSALRFRPAADA